ncbi:MAG: signal peptidase I [Candidatus Omnitrophota bacterium]
MIKSNKLNELHRQYSKLSLDELIRTFTKETANVLNSLPETEYNTSSRKEFLDLSSAFSKDYKESGRLNRTVFVGQKKVKLLFKKSHKIITLIELILGNNNDRPGLASLFEKWSYVYSRLHNRFASRDWIESIIVAFFLAMVIRSFVVQAFKIPTGSMRMTLIEGDLILVNKFIYGPKVPFTKLRLPAVREPKRGDVIVFIYPEDRKKDFIKRLVGLPGETVEIKGGSIYINDRPVTEPIFNQIYYFNKGELALAGQKIIVPKDSYFVLGDNSASSKDSRFWGFVTKDDLLGQAMIIYWPIPRIRIIK